MPPSSQASQRYEIIDRCLTNLYNQFPNMEKLKWAIKRELNKAILYFGLEIKLPRGYA